MNEKIDVYFHDRALIKLIRKQQRSISVLGLGLIFLGWYVYKLDKRIEESKEIKESVE